MQTRRTFLGALGGLAIIGEQAPVRRYRVLLNSNISGPQAFLFLAQDRHLREAGLDAEFVASSCRSSARCRWYGRRSRVRRRPPSGCC